MSHPTTPSLEQILNEYKVQGFRVIEEGEQIRAFEGEIILPAAELVRIATHARELTKQEYGIK